MHERFKNLNLFPTEPIHYDFGPRAADADQEIRLPRLRRPPVPVNILAIRHAPSEVNVLNDLLRSGKPLSPEALALRDVPDNVARLAVGATEFTHAAVEWLKINIKFPIDAQFTSPFIRTKETAGHIGTELGLTKKWKVDSRIGERSYGDFAQLSFDEKLAEWKKRREDVRYWTPPNGESMENIELEARSFLNSISLRFSNGSVMFVSHGEFILGLRSVIEYPSNAGLIQMIEDGTPNCGIVHYTRQDPVSGEIAPYYKWVRLVDPRGKNPAWDGKWKEITRPTYSNDDLLAEAEKYPRRLNFSTRR